MNLEDIKNTLIDLRKAEQREQLLDILQEECAEIIQAISKMRRFGENGYHPLDETKTPNHKLLAREIGDFMETLRLLKIDQREIKFGMRRKLANLKKYGVID